MLSAVFVTVLNAGVNFILVTTLFDQSRFSFSLS